MKRLVSMALIIALALGMLLPLLNVSAEVACDGMFEITVEDKISYESHLPGAQLKLGSAKYIKLYELDYGKGSFFKVEVWIRGVKDMYAYEFTLNWQGSKYWIPWNYTVEQIWPGQIVVRPDVTFNSYLANEKAYVPIGYYPAGTFVMGDPAAVPPQPGVPFKFAVTALPPATGVSGDFKLATVFFYIYNDMSYPDGDTLVPGAYSYSNFKIWLCARQASDSCSRDIILCNDHEAYVRFYGVAPDIEIRTADGGSVEINNVVGEKFKKEIWITDIVRFKSIHFDLLWNWWFVDPHWHKMLRLEYVEWNEAVFKHRDPTSTAVLTEPITIDPANVYTPLPETQPGVVDKGWVPAGQSVYSWLDVDMEMKCDQPEIRGKEILLMTLTFQKLDPWDCDAQPPYIYRQPHEWMAGNATCEFFFNKGWFDVYVCPLLYYPSSQAKENIYFGKVFDTYFNDGYQDPMGEFETAGYGEAGWIEDATTETVDAGMMVELITHATGDLAAVGIDITGSGITTDDVTEFEWTYYLTAGAGSWIGPYLAVLVDTTGDTLPDYVLISDDPQSDGITPLAPFVYDLVAMDTIGWDFSIFTYPGLIFANFGTIAFFNTFYGPGEIEGLSLFMQSTGPADQGSAVVDLVTIYGGALTPWAPWSVTYDFEPPFQTDYYWSEDLWDLSQHYIANLFIFQPIPGDLNRDGVVDIVDVMMIVGHYGHDATCPFNLDGINGVDIFDIVIVAKQFGRTTP